MPRLTLEAARSLNVGRILYHHIEKNADGTPVRARVNGRLKVWKRPRSPQWELPMKYGFKTGFYINETTMEDWFTLEDEARLFHKGFTITNAPHSKVPNGAWYIKCAGQYYETSVPFASFEEALAYGAGSLLPEVRVTKRKSSSVKKADFVS